MDFSSFKEYGTVYEEALSYIESDSDILGLLEFFESRGLVIVCEYRSSKKPWWAIVYELPFTKEQAFASSVYNTREDALYEAFDYAFEYLAESNKPRDLSPIEYRRFMDIVNGVSGQSFIEIEGR